MESLLTALLVLVPGATGTAGVLTPAGVAGGTGDGSLASLREVSAEVLRAAQERAEQSGEPLEPLLAGGRAARILLDGDNLAARLDRALVEARWRAYVSQDGARSDRSVAAELASALERIEGDLTFEPLMEADVPRGFPSPTPVGQIELKSYPGYRLARTASGRRSNGAFWKLFLHIERNEIAMTAPVEMTYAEDERGLREDQMAFLYANRELGELGSDGSVEVLDAPDGLAVSLGCRGDASRAAIEAASAELAAWIAERADLTVTGELRVLGYNSPMVPRNQRYFEVQWPVTQNQFSASRPSPSTDALVFDFRSASLWSSVDDSVMGGVSASRMVRTEAGAAAFVGELSLANNGGFCSVRSATGDWKVGDAEELVLRFRGDGNRYKLRLRTDDRWDGVSYEQPFETTPGIWTEQRFPLSDFRPVWRGRTVPGADPLDPARIRTFGILVSDGQEGAFRLELESLAQRVAVPKP